MNLDVKFSNFKNDKKTFLKIEDANPIEESVLKFNFLFESKTGLLSESNFSTLENRNGRLEEKKERRRMISDYVNYNGFFFPSNTTIIFYRIGVTYQIKVNKRTIKIGEPIDEKEFDVILPPGSKVKDSIKGVSYITPSIGNTGAEKKIVKELDALFEETKK